MGSVVKFCRQMALPVSGALVLAGMQPLVNAALAAPAGQGEAAGATAPQAVDPADVEGVIFERQQVMLQLEKDAEQLGLIVAGLAPKEKLAETARAVANGARDSQASFQSLAPGGRSRSEVWSNWDDYNQRMQVFVARSDAMAKMAEAGNVNGVVEILSDAMPCKACHDAYRTPKKPG